jgi:hypothetical protein
MRKMKLIGLLFGYASITACTILPNGDACLRDHFPNYMTCFETIRTVSSPTYDALVQYGRSLSVRVVNQTITNEKAFALFDERRIDAQRQLAEAQSRAIANAMRRSSADPK